MNTIKLYEADAYLREFTAVVKACVSEAGIFKVALDQTAFYPEGGGQPADTGMLGEAKVVDVQEADGVIWHTVTQLLEPGKEVTGAIDFERRFSMMQNHSGEHIVSGIITKKYGCSNVGFHMGTDGITMDFDYVLNEEQLADIEREANAVVLGDVPIRVYYPPSEELKELEYRSKKALSGEVRIVEVEGCDRCACCGTHVSHTGEIRLIKFLRLQNYKGGVRITMLCGERAFEDYRTKHENLTAAARLLSVKPEQVEDSVVRLKEKNIELKRELNQLRKQLRALESE